MLISALKNALILDEFPINEQPLPIYRDDKDVEPAAEPGDKEEAEKSNGGAMEGDDFLGTVSNLLVEIVRLEAEVNRWEGGAGEDVFDRFVKQLLPWLDTFWHMMELARDNPPSEEVANWLKQYESLYFRILKMLESFDLIFLKSAGKPVNLETQEVVEFRTTKDYPHEYVIRELQRGVAFRGRLLREARVVVANNPSD